MTMGPRLHWEHSMVNRLARVARPHLCTRISLRADKPSESEISTRAMRDSSYRTASPSGAPGSVR